MGATCSLAPMSSRLLVKDAKTNISSLIQAVMLRFCLQAFLSTSNDLFKHSQPQSHTSVWPMCSFCGFRLEMKLFLAYFTSPMCQCLYFLSFFFSIPAQLSTIPGNSLCLKYALQTMSVPLCEIKCLSCIKLHATVNMAHQLQPMTTAVSGIQT